MKLNRVALATLVGSATVLAGCGRPATLAVPAATLTTAAGTAGTTLALPQPEAAQAAAVAAPTAPIAAPLELPAGAVAEIPAADAPAAPVLADPAVAEEPVSAAVEDGGMHAEGLFDFFRRPRPTPPPVTSRPRPTPPPIYATPRPTPPPIYATPRPTPPPIYATPRPTPPPIYTPPPVSDVSRVYGSVGGASVDLSRETHTDNIRGYLDGRSVDLTVGTGRLTGSIGTTNVYLSKDSGYLWAPPTLAGSLGNRNLSLKIDGRNTYGSIGSLYFDTTISSDDRTLTGRYAGGGVNVRTSGSALTGYMGSYAVSVSKGYDGRLTGYIGTRYVSLAGAIGLGGFLRRLPLIASDNWLVISTLTRFFI